MVLLCKNEVKFLQKIQNLYYNENLVSQWQTEKWPNFSKLTWPIWQPCLYSSAKKQAASACQFSKLHFCPPLVSRVATTCRYRETIDLVSKKF